MGLLAPLYALAALAVVAPVIFHLIRRQPRGQVEFSSLMFLQASPPRLTRRSRLDNLWLLLLRATALILIALAFARPFLRSVELADAQAAGREILMLIDTSGSMQREDVWRSAIATAKETIDGLGADDRIGLATFDTALNLVVPLPDDDEKSNSTAESDQATVRSELDKLNPGFRGTRLAEQLIAAAELMQARTTSRGAVTENESEIILISDLHESSRLDALQGFAWPENIRLDVRRVTSDKVGNARATLMQASSQASDSSNTASDESKNRFAKEASEKNGPEKNGPEKKGAEKKGADDTDVVRIRIENNASSTQTALSLTWMQGAQSADKVGMEYAAAVMNIQVPPGQARVIPMPTPPGSADRIVLSGDVADHDNTLYVPRTAPRQERLGFIGDARSKSEDDLFFFLAQVPLSTPVRNVSIERLKKEELSQAISDESLAGLVVEWPVPASSVPTLEEFCRQGRPVVIVFARPVKDQLQTESQEKPAESEESQAQILAKLLGIDGEVEIAEAKTRDFALLTDIDFKHRLFQPLSDAKFNDFGKVRFWSHRALTLPEQESSAGNLQVLSRFDDHAPAIIHRSIGRGDLWLLTAGWQTTASQLALSSKFVPLLFGMLDPQGQTLQLTSVYEVGEIVPIAPGAIANVTNLDGSPVRTLTQASGLSFEQPGIYWLSEEGKRRQIAIAMPLSESQLDPLELDRFAQYGVVTGKSGTAKERNESARLSQVTELESRQKLWRWILMAALGFLVIETLVAARLQNQSLA